MMAALRARRGKQIAWHELGTQPLAGSPKDRGKAEHSANIIE
jgi:hypothetical protein